MTTWYAIVIVLISQMFAAVGALYLKKGSKNVHRRISSFLLNRFVLIGLLLYGISAVMFVPALKYGELSVLYPLVSTTYIWATLLSMYVLGEKMNSSKWIGIGLILAGVVVIGM
jgi:uncharacterized membrane protein